MTQSIFISQFSPQRTDPAALEEIFVQREDLLQESVEKVRESILSQNKHHLLFIGQRGAGKTHLVTLIHHRLQQPELENRVRFAWLNEDESATSFLRLLVLIYREVSTRYPAEFPETELTSLAGQKPEIALDQLGKALLRHLGEKTLVVLMENLDSLFKDMNREEQLAWRAFVQNHPVFATVATAQSLFDGVSDRDEPFFGFFDTQHLEPLGVDDALTLLKKLAKLNERADLLAYLESPKGQARCAAIHELAGGNPRLYLILSDFLTPDSLDDLVRPFEEMVDRQLTSYYQERLRWLSPQQREIIQFLCRIGHPVPVKQIAEGLFTGHNSITGQLKTLRDYRYVNSRQLGREVYYELAEPLMRLAIQVKETRDHKPLALIVDFLRVWYDRPEIEKQFELTSADSLARAYLLEVLALLDSEEPSLRVRLWQDSLEKAGWHSCDDNALAVARAIASETDEPSDWLALALRIFWRRDFSEATKILTPLTETKELPREKFIISLNLLSICLMLEDQWQKSIEISSRSIEEAEAESFYLVWGFGNRALALVSQQRYSEALNDLESMLIAMNETKADISFNPFTALIIRCVFSHTNDPVRWSGRIGDFLGHIVRLDANPLYDLEPLSGLGAALVRHIPNLALSPLKHCAYDEWCDAWKAACSTLPVEAQDTLSIPLQMLRAGIDYLKTKQEVSLITLPSEERKLLRLILGLPPEQTQG